MLFTKKTEYAVRCVVYLAIKKEKIVNNREISSAMHIPEYFLSKVLQSLIQNGIVISSRGMNGGYTLAKQSHEINLLEVIEAIQGPLRFSVCFLDEKKCECKRECIINRIWMRINASVEDELKSLKIAEFTGKVKNTGPDQYILQSCLGLPGSFCCQMRS